MITGETYLCRVLATVIGACISGLAAAQQIEEITVAAQKRAQSSQDVPISIQVFSGDALDQLGISASEDLALAAPGLNTSTRQI